MAEMGCKPVSFHWCKLVCRYWNRLVSQSSYPLLTEAFHENLAMTKEARFWGWSSDALQLLRSCVPEHAGDVAGCIDSGSMDTLGLVDEDAVMDAWSASWEKCWETTADPRAAASSEVLCATYKAWMQNDFGEAAPYVDYSGIIEHDHLMDLMHFRMGAHWLRVVTGRWEGAGGIPRTDRLCTKCPHFRVEDEKHFVFECPAYNHIRGMERFKGLYDECQGDMATLMCHPAQSRVASLVHALKVCRNDELQLLHYDVHLDSFDSDSDAGYAQ